MPPAPHRLRLDGEALCHNWRALDRMSGTAATGAAVKADGYGLGAVEVARRLAAVGCRDFFVSTWAEAAALAPLCLPVAVLHGVREEDMDIALSGIAKPVLNTAGQIARWRQAGGGVCDVMVDTGMNRLGVAPEEVGAGLLDGLALDTLHSHLACADEPESAHNERQRAAFSSLRGRTTARRMSLANSAGTALGEPYHFDLVRPGLALYGGEPCSAFAGRLRQVAALEAQVLQRRRVGAGETVGYNAKWTAPAGTAVAIINIGYADGYFRAFSNCGHAWFRDAQLQVVGRVSMDLVALSAATIPSLQEGDWVVLDFEIPIASRVSRISQYELLTSLGARLQRRWNI
ncbi:alanine racemase [Sphingomonas gellani]|uniref:alanine racemase n=1 Tax=Sphingomonas gellani TaxID=1166340 RepID=UPI000B81F156|nr:alanine racemase [Sphingomonas gellani]